MSRDRKWNLEPAPDVEALLDPDFTRRDFDLALRKVIGAPLTAAERAELRARYGSKVAAPGVAASSARKREAPDEGNDSGTGAA